MAHDLRVVDLDLMPLKLADLEARVAALPDLGDAEDWAMSYWYDYLWDGDVFMPEDDEPGDEMWARVAGEIAALARPAALTREQAWAIGALAFSSCGHELHERI